MKKIIYILLSTNLVFSQTASLDTNTILIGEQTNLTITNLIDDTDIWPSYKDFLIKEIEVIEASIIDTNNGIISQNITITAWDSGSYYIPPIIFSEENKTEGILLNVETLELEEDAKLKDIKKPFKEPISWSDIWPFLLVGLIISLLIYLIKKYLPTRKGKAIEAKPILIIPADVTALQQLNQLETTQIWQKGNIKEYHSKLSEIIRRYSENRFDFMALELTTDEILEELRGILDTEQLSNLKILLQRADLAKFAKNKPLDTKNIESMVLAKQFVNTTKKIRKNE